MGRGRGLSCSVVLPELAFYFPRLCLVSGGVSDHMHVSDTRAPSCPLQQGLLATASPSLGAQGSFPPNCGASLPLRDACARCDRSARQAGDGGTRRTPVPIHTRPFTLKRLISDEAGLGPQLRAWHAEPGCFWPWVSPAAGADWPPQRRGHWCVGGHPFAAAPTEVTDGF